MLRRMAARGQSAQPAEYKALLADILDRRAIKDGKALFEAMLAAGHHPSTREVEQVVGMMARAGHTDRAEQLLALLAEKDVRIPADARNEIVLGWAKAGDVDKTRTALAEVEDAGGTSTSHHHNALLTAVIAAGNVDAAWQQAAHLADRAIPSGENLEGLVELIQRIHLELDGGGRSTLPPGRSDRGCHTTGCGDVVVLDEDRVAEPESVIHPTSRADRLFLK